MKVTKRDGRKVMFNGDKIKDAVLAAFSDVDGETSSYSENKANEIAKYVCSLDKDMSVEEIQNIVEEKLMASNRKDVAKSYILYRDNRSRERQWNSKLNKEITKALMASDVKNQNANVDEHSFGGRIGAASDAVNKDYALNYCMSEMAKQNHLNNEIYIHDLNSYAVGLHNCLSVPMDKLLANGFTTRQVDIRPANSINTAFQLVAVIFQIQSLNQFGGVSATHLDWTMVPYIRKSFVKHWIDGMYYLENEVFDADKEYFYSSSIENKVFKQSSTAYRYAMDMTIKELQQAVEGLYHNLNSLQSRSGNQLPFSSVNLGTCTSIEGRMVIKAMLEGCLNGVGEHHTTSIFPCLIFQYMKGVNDKPGAPNYDMYQLALKSTAQRLYPNYCNVDWSGNIGYDPNDPKQLFSTMGKRKLSSYKIFLTLPSGVAYSC